jgi:hypothetical protein
MSSLTELRREAEEADRRAARLKRMVEFAEELGEEGLNELLEFVSSSGSQSQTNGNGHAKRSDPRGREALRLIVRERPGVWTLTELREEMQRRGWFTTANGVEAAAKRLCKINGEGRRLGPGRYVFPANHGEEVVDRAQSELSGGATIPFDT